MEKQQPQLDEDARKRLEDIQNKVDDFKEKLLDHFQGNILGISLLPPSKDDKETINVAVVVDDMDSEKLTKQELRQRTQNVINDHANAVDEAINPQVFLITDVWQKCFDGEYDVIDTLGSSAIIYDNGMLSAFKISKVHKQKVLSKFEEYIVSYVLAGSLVQGEATPESDIDVFIVIDDTDVKKMSRAELKDKLRAIIQSMGAEAAEETGIDKHFNIQVYILTDFWEHMKEANPIIFTFLRDGVPLYDRGVFMPWKQLLKMGRIKPSPEAIDKMMQTGDKVLKKAKKKLKEIALEDFFWATITTSQAAIMLYGLPPPTPKETTELLREVFVEKEDLLDEEYVEIVEDALQFRKDIEHGNKDEVKGAEIDELMEKSQKYLERCNDLFDEIRNLKEGEGLENTLDEIRSYLHRALDTDEESDEHLVKIFKQKLVGRKGFTVKDHNKLKDVLEAGQEYENDNLTKAEMSKSMKTANSLLRKIVEFVQREEFKDMKKSKTMVQFDEGYGEIYFLRNNIYVYRRTEDDEDVKVFSHDDRAITDMQESSPEEMQEALDEEETINSFINQELMNKIEEEFGDNPTFIME